MNDRPLPYPLLRCLIEGRLCEQYDPNRARTPEELTSLIERLHLENVCQVGAQGRPAQ